MTSRRLFDKVIRRLALPEDPGARADKLGCQIRGTIAHVLPEPPQAARQVERLNVGVAGRRRLRSIEVELKVVIVQSKRAEANQGA